MPLLKMQIFPPTDGCFDQKYVFLKILAAISECNDHQLSFSLSVAGSPRPNFSNCHN